ncbi:hypothetical protein FYK55_16500 [Roseiconus nitratireducens]|uniref:Cytochrome c oxidase subunit 4 n=1 Tax=Roseiconus nitratireducens TaxID=2605748 RepID=A0A5M6D5F5_9BACT|nr:cytochrome C oxidase subunit IV family protein [Roseiconus nitratireducens]KAA5541810.1 hypothetical protein FYK55_16500 [Roseiconus nitratireducens]
MRSHQLSIYLTFLALTLLLAATIGLSFVDIRPWNLWLGLAIATAKMLLIAWVFMNLAHSIGPVRVAAAAGLLWLSFAIVCTLADYTTRGWGETPEHWLRQTEHVESYDRVEPPQPEFQIPTASGRALDDSDLGSL